MNASAYHHRRGFGQSGQQVTQSVGSTLLTTGGLIAATGNPIAGAAVALAGAITDLLASVGVGKGCGQTCITATAFANQAEVLLQENLAQYMALPTPRPYSAQQAAIANFQQIWNGLQYACAGVPGTAGTNCIADRQAGACKWTDAQGNCWNWFTGYLYPIQNDPNVAPAGSVSTGSSDPISAAASLVSAAAGGDSTLLWIGVAVIGVAILAEVL